MFFGLFSSKKPEYVSVGEECTTKDGSFDALIDTFLISPEDRRFISSICTTMLAQDLGEQKENTQRYFKAQTKMTQDKRYFLEIQYVASEGVCKAFVKLDKQEVEPFFALNKQLGSVNVYVTGVGSKDLLFCGVV